MRLTIPAKWTRNLSATVYAYILLWEVSYCINVDVFSGQSFFPLRVLAKLNGIIASQ